MTEQRSAGMITITGTLLGTAVSVLPFLGCSSGPTSPSVPTAGGTYSSTTSGGALATNTGGVSVSGTSGSTATSASSPVASGLPASCSGVCNAATAVNPRLTDYGALGNVTMYSTVASDGGACQYGATQILYFAASNVNLAPNDGQGQWQEGRICGQCVEVTVLTSQGPKQVVVRIMDRCADENCGMDLGGSAPSAVMLDGFGRYPGAWRLVSCVGHPETYDGDASLFVKEGSNAFWSAVQVRNPDMAVAAIDWQRQDDATMNGRFAYGSPSIENFYFVPAEVLSGNATYVVTVHYSDGSTATTALTSAQLAQPEGHYPLQ